MLTEHFDETVLPNGIRVISETMPHARSVSIGVWVRSGPRYEESEQAGISHFIEHMLFKGTRSRTAQQINESLYPVGGHLNAFTDREVTCYTALVLEEDTPLAIEVLSDMLTNSIFAPEELVREKNVILEEIRAIEDTPEDLVHDVFASTIWPDHPLGQPVIGNMATVSALSRDSVVNYVKERYTAGSVLVAAAGAVKHGELTALVDRWMGSMTGSDALPKAIKPVARHETTLVYRKTEQVHVCLGMSAYAQQDDDNYPMVILDTVLGGGPHSRLFEEVRENRGLAYNVGSSLTAYAEGGLFTVFASTGPKNLTALIQIVREQLDRVVQEGLTETEIDLARRHIRASWLLAHESTGSRMGRIANSQLYFDRLISFEEVIAKLEAVTREEILRIARAVLQPEAGALAIVGPINPASKQARLLRAA